MGSGIAVGLDRGHIVTLRTRKPSQHARKKKMTARNKLVKETVREVAGFAPYERRMMELLKLGSAASFKRCLKFAKKRLGTHRRGKKKRDEMEATLQAMRMKKGAQRDRRRDPART